LNDSLRQSYYSYKPLKSTSKSFMCSWLRHLLHCMRKPWVIESTLDMIFNANILSASKSGSNLQLKSQISLSSLLNPSENGFPWSKRIVHTPRDVFSWILSSIIFVGTDTTCLGDAFNSFRNFPFSLKFDQTESKSSWVLSI
jgi:hypothetical protein